MMDYARRGDEPHDLAAVVGRVLWQKTVTAKREMLIDMYKVK